MTQRDEQPQGQAYGLTGGMTGAPPPKKEEAKAAKPKPVPMTPGTPPRPMTPNEIIVAGRSNSTEAVVVVKEEEPAAEEEE